MQIKFPQKSSNVIANSQSIMRRYKKQINDTVSRKLIDRHLSTRTHEEKKCIPEQFSVMADSCSIL